MVILSNHRPFDKLRVSGSMHALFGRALGGVNLTELFMNEVHHRE
jgi:hypothetical protein